MCVLCIPGASVIRTRVLSIRRGQHFSWYPLLLTYVTDIEPLRSEMNTLLLFCQESEKKTKQCHDKMHFSFVHNEYEKRITKFSVYKKTWWVLTGEQNIHQQVYFLFSYVFFFTDHFTISTSTGKIILYTSFLLPTLVLCLCNFVSVIW